MDGSLSGYLPNAVKMIQADPKFLDQAKDAAGKGEYQKATRKVLAYLSMGFGHDLDYQSELLDQGNYKAAAGAVAGTATALLGPDAALSGVSAGVRALPRVSSLTPEAQAAVDAGRASGLPIDAATA